ncbi:MAG TPA: HmuY family protein [Longimicrobiales bacterium]
MQIRDLDRPPVVLIAGIAGAAALLVALSLRRPEPSTYAPTIAAPVEVGLARIGPAEYTIDASAADEWRYFDFSRNAVVEDPGPMGWDLAFRRFHIIANGGIGFAGSGGIADLGEIPFDSVRTLPASGYRPNIVRSDTTNPGIGKWYDYAFTSHLLTPEPRTYAVRTADGRYAKFAILSYYCTGARPGCITIRYAYRGDGGREF